MGILQLIIGYVVNNDERIVNEERKDGRLRRRRRVTYRDPKKIEMETVERNESNTF